MKKLLILVLLAALLCAAAFAESEIPAAFAASRGLTVMDEDEINRRIGSSGSQSETTKHNCTLLSMAGNEAGNAFIITWNDGETQYMALKKFSLSGQSNPMAVVEVFKDMCQEFAFDAYAYIQVDGTMLVFIRNKAALFELSASNRSMKVVGSLDELFNAIPHS